jgi:HlyD family secretion protein
VRFKKATLIVFPSSCLLLLAFFWLSYRAPASTSFSAANSTFMVQSVPFHSAIRVAGTTQASRSFYVLAPQLEGANLDSLLITKLMSSGAKVRKGDVLVEFDPQAQVKDSLDKQSTYKNLANQVAQKKADEEAARAKDDTALKQAENDLKRAQLDIQKDEIVSRIDAEKNRETLEQTQATLKQLRETYELKRRAAAAGIRILEIQRDRALEAMRYSQSNAEKMVIRSPMDGVVVLNTIELGGRMGTVQQGNEVRPGVPFLQVVDPSQMEIRVEINQADLLALKPGFHAVARFDAYPGMTLPTTLEEVAPLGRAGSFSQMVRRFSSRFSVQGTDPRLLPDLSAALDVDLLSIPNALAVPRQSIAGEPGKEFVWLKSGGSFEKRPVRLGPKNDTDVVVETGLASGDIIRRIASPDQTEAAAQ